MPEYIAHFEMFGEITIQILVQVFSQSDDSHSDILHTNRNIIMKIETLHELNTEQPADTVEWCTHPRFPNHFIYGTYQLEESENDFSKAPTCRIGRIYLYKYDIHTNKLESLDSIQTAAILDAKWHISGEKCLLLVASALSEILLFELGSDEKLHAIDGFNMASDGEDNLLTLSLDISNDVFINGGDNILASDSRGSVSLLSLTPSKIIKKRDWKAHSFEAWTCAFDTWNGNVVYTGGDDTFMHIFDVRSTETSKVVTNKSHTAGVTSILSYDEHRLITGSYDETLRIFDTRTWREPLYELMLFGGIWRIKPSKIERKILLCACMYKNFSICMLNQDATEANLVAEFTKHESICYGADWAPSKLSNGNQIMATCSFYDKKLCLSTVYL